MQDTKLIQAVSCRGANNHKAVAKCLTKYNITVRILINDERFKRYGCSEPGMFSDLVCREACPCNSKQDIILGKEW